MILPIVFLKVLRVVKWCCVVTKDCRLKCSHRRDGFCHLFKNSVVSPVPGVSGVWKKRPNKKTSLVWVF